MLLLVLHKGDFILDVETVASMRQALEKAKELLLPCTVFSIEPCLRKTDGIQLSIKGRLLLLKERLWKRD
jgi:hypothetical protein